MGSETQDLLQIEMPHGSGLVEPGRQAVGGQQNSLWSVTSDDLSQGTNLQFAIFDLRFETSKAIEIFDYRLTFQKNIVLQT